MNTFSEQKNKEEIVKSRSIELNNLYDLEKKDTCRLTY